MKFSALILTLSSVAAFAQEAAPTQDGQQPAGGLLGSPIFMMVAIFVIMWFFFIRPKNKEMKQMEEMRKSLKKGDRVMTAAGIIGTVSSIDETGTTITIRTGSTTFIDFEKQAILRVLNAEPKVEEKKDEKK